MYSNDGITSEARTTLHILSSSDHSQSGHQPHGHALIYLKGHEAAWPDGQAQWLQACSQRRRGAQ
jgi:hypothetical protein